MYAYSHDMQEDAAHVITVTMMPVVMAVDMRMVVQVRRVHGCMCGKVLVDAELVARCDGRENALQICGRFWWDRRVWPFNTRVMDVAHREVVIQAESWWM